MDIVDWLYVADADEEVSGAIVDGLEVVAVDAEVSVATDEAEEGDFDTEVPVAVEVVDTTSVGKELVEVVRRVDTGVVEVGEIIIVLETFSDEVLLALEVDVVGTPSQPGSGIP